MDIVISSLRTYPIKSCAALVHEHAIGISPAGLELDREWVIVDPDGRFMTQRRWPRMALIHARPRAGGLTLSVPGQADFELDSLPTEPAQQRVPVRIWSADCVGRDEGDAVAAYLSAFLATPCRLLRRFEQVPRLPAAPLVQAWELEQGTEHELNEGQGFAFADALPFLITNEASLDELNQHIERAGDQAVGMERFRPNIVLSGLPAYEEDYIYAWQTDGLYFAVLKACTRCPLPNVDQYTAQVGTQPVQALMQTRQSEAGMLFGVQAVLAQPGARSIQVGQPLQAEYRF